MPQTPTQPGEVVLSALPTIRSREAAHTWINDVLGIPVPLNTVRDAANKKQIASVKRAGALYFSTQALYDWVVRTFEVGNPQPAGDRWWWEQS